MNEKNKFCCKGIELLINDPESPLEYEPAQREYSLVNIPKLFRKKNELALAFIISHCPRCGKELPKNLSDEWFSIIEKEFSVDGFLDEKIDSLPQEYKSDEWWKKQGL